MKEYDIVRVKETGEICEILHIHKGFDGRTVYHVECTERSKDGGYDSHDFFEEEIEKI